MVDVSYAEALEAEANEHFEAAGDELAAGNAKLREAGLINDEVTVIVDSQGRELSVGDTVRVSDEKADGVWDATTFTFTESREFDFAEVMALNEDGTVSVLWDSAGCGCSSDSPTRNENPADLTLSNDNEVDIYYRGRSDGESVGRKQNQYALRRALGLSADEDTEDN